MAFQTYTGRLFDLAGNPLDGWLVLVGKTPPQSPQVWWAARTDATGAFSVQVDGAAQASAFVGTAAPNAVPSPAISANVTVAGTTLTVTASVRRRRGLTYLDGPSPVPLPGLLVLLRDPSNTNCAVAGQSDAGASYALWEPQGMAWSIVGLLPDVVGTSRLTRVRDNADGTRDLFFGSGIARTHPFSRRDDPTSNEADPTRPGRL